MEILDKTHEALNFQWIDYSYLPDSKAHRVEIYSKNSSDVLTGLIDLFFELFNKFSNNILISNDKWGEYTLDLWNIQNTKNFNSNNISVESTRYLEMLKSSHIELEYDGLCKCNDWQQFLYIVLDCIIKHIAPYSPFFYITEEEIMFYFHHSGSIGVYYKTENIIINDIINSSKGNDYIINYPNKNN